MAKISANNATKLDQFEKNNLIYCYCSDGRVLRKIRYNDGTCSSWTIIARKVAKEKWDAFKGATLNK